MQEYNLILNRTKLISRVIYNLKAHWEHEVDIIAVVSKRVATITKNRYGTYGTYK